MSVLLTSILTLVLCLSTMTRANQLIAGINYGDDLQAVTNKLKSSKLVTSKISKNLLSRTDINGSFTTANKLAGMKFKLFFDWAESGNLEQVTYRSSALPSSDYNHKLKSSWKRAITVLTSIYGKASNLGDFPPKSKLAPGAIEFSHEWKINNGYIYLGVGQETKSFTLNIRFCEFSLTAHQ